MPAHRDRHRLDILRPPQNPWGCSVTSGKEGDEPRTTGDTHTKETTVTLEKAMCVPDGAAHQRVSLEPTSSRGAWRLLLC